MISFNSFATNSDEQSKREKKNMDMTTASGGVQIISGVIFNENSMIHLRHMSAMMCVAAEIKEDFQSDTNVECQNVNTFSRV